jgi:outer membrane protein OmpA-like peptidoglycan-associated protein
MTTTPPAPAGRRRRAALLVPLIVAVLGLAAIVVLEEMPARHGMEGSLTDRSTKALHDAGLTGATVTFHGRDGTVYVTQAADADRALAIVKALDGVRNAQVVVPTATGSTATPTPSVSLIVTPTPTPTATPTVTPTPTATPTPTPSASTSSVQRELDALGAIEFATGSAELTTADRAVVAKVAAILEANPTVRVQIQGDTDSTGTSVLNQRLSVARATAVYHALVTLGIDGGRLHVVGYGESRPVASNDNPGGRARNRRVDIEVAE